MRLATEPCDLLFKIEIVLKKIDVLIVGDFPPATHTGISMVNAMVHDILAENGKLVQVIDESAWSYKGFVRIAKYLFGSHLRLLKYLLSSKTRYVYLNVPLSFAGELRLLLSCLIVKTFSYRSKIIGHIHRGDIREWATSTFINRYILRFNLKFFCRIVLLSKKFENDLLDINPKIKTVVIPNTSLLEGVQRSKATNFKGNFVCISNIIKTKGLGDLVEAFNDKRLSGFRLTIAGNVYDREFYNSVSKSANVDFVISPEREKIIEILMQADCLILPSWNEGQPLVILEAMSLGIPIIATEVGDIPDMLGEGYPFLCKPHNPIMLAEKILMFSTYENKVALGERLLSVYKSRYSNMVFTNNILQLFA
ncbi:glycosyltransferase family 4 protein [Tenuifilum thalassicum]|uniref:Glycosyltransferase family 4 protein n=1 Tax=Tenuifilum thalassicum TaxID=2590900 RepID=A0A7D3XGT0_9BACT|nr:glycosyltransferase family 4 protein [Tenuifilum thalassicum]